MFVPFGMTPKIIMIIQDKHLFVFSVLLLVEICSR